MVGGMGGHDETMVLQRGETHQVFPSVFAPLFSASLRSCAALNYGSPMCQCYFYFSERQGRMMIRGERPGWGLMQGTGTRGRRGDR